MIALLMIFKFGSINVSKVSKSFVYLKTYIVPLVFLVKHTNEESVCSEETS